MTTHGAYGPEQKTWDDGINLISNPEQFRREPGERELAGARWDPRSWSKRRATIFAVVTAIVLILALILGVYFGVRANRYPSYNKLNYSIRDTYDGKDFFDKFDYFTGYDPTQGFVHYVDRSGSEDLNLTYATTNHAILRVDTSENNASTGRKSARISSKQQYDNGLFVFDINHSPYGCATWSAVWLVDETNWPEFGEIDVLESVNQGTSGNQMTLHTRDGCSMKSVKRKQEGQILNSNCLNSTDNNAGCGVQGPEDTYGEAFNKNGGGIYAMELRDAGIRMWFFDRASIPADVRTGTAPDPSTWGTAIADFPSTECDIGSHFKNQSITVNIDLCGSWAGAENVYSQQDRCPGQCRDFVATNATAFENAYWGFNSFKVYQAA